MPLSDRRRAIPNGHFGGSGEHNTNIQYGERPTRALGHSQLRASQSTMHTKYCIESSSALPNLSPDLDWTEQLSEYRNFHSKKRKRKCPGVPGEVSGDGPTAPNKTNNAASNDIGGIGDIDDIESIGTHLNSTLERQYSNSTTDTILTNDDQTDTISTLSQPDIEMTCESGNILLTENELRLFDVNEHQSMNQNINVNVNTNTTGGETNEIDDINEDDERWETEINENETDWFIDMPDCQSDDIDLVTNKQNNNDSVTTGNDINFIDTNETNDTNVTDKNNNNNNNNKNTNNNSNSNNNNGGNSSNENGNINSASDTDNSSFADNSPLANIIRTRFQKNTNQFRQTRLQFRRTPNRTMMLDINNNDNSGNDLVDVDNDTNTVGAAGGIQNNNNNNAINNDPNTNTSINNSNNNTNSSNNNNNSNNHLIWDSESTRVRLDRDKTEVLSTLYNYMKISEMDRYGIEIFDKGLRSVLDELTESDFQSLATSYWCNGIHFECMIKYRGSKISNNEKLQLPISSTLMDQAVTGGASVNKIKSLLLQKRKDTKNLKLSLKQELEFFRRNCHIRFWNHEVLVRSFLENGWLTPEIAQIGLNKFLLHIFDRAVRNRSQKKQSKKPAKNKQNKNNSNNDVRNTCNGTNNTGNLNKKTPPSSSYKCPALQYGNVSFDIDMNASTGGSGSSSNNNRNFNNNYYNRNKNKNKNRKRKRSNRKGNNGHNGHTGSNGHTGQNDATTLFGYPSEDDRDTILNRDGNTRDLDPINFSEKTLHRWCCLIEILCSRGAKCPKAKFKGVPQLAHSATSGKNTWWIISTPVAKKNDLLMSAVTLTLPNDLWKLISSYF